MRRERQRTKAAEPRARIADSFTVEAKPGKAADDLLYRDLTFESGNGHAGAGMAAGRERQMVIRRARDFEPVWFGKNLRVAIRRADAQMQIRAGLQQRVCDLHGLDHESVAQLIRAFAAQTFLDSWINQSGVRAQPLQLIFMSEEQVQGVADEIRRSFVSGVKQEYAVVQELCLADRLRSAFLPD
jgi:hypothetical protein